MGGTPFDLPTVESILAECVGDRDCFVSHP
jgi:hypothetical protein